MSLFSPVFCAILATTTGQNVPKDIPAKLYRSMLVSQLAQAHEGTVYLKVFQSGNEYRVLKFRNPGDGPVLVGFCVYGQDGVFYQAPTLPSVAFNKDGSMVVSGIKYECVDTIVPPLSHFDESVEMVIPPKENAQH